MSRTTKRIQPSNISVEEIMVISRADPVEMDAAIADFARRKGEAEQAETVLRKTQVEVGESVLALDASRTDANEALKREQGRHLAELETKQNEIMARENTLEQRMAAVELREDECTNRESALADLDEREAAVRKAAQSALEARAVLEAQAQ